MNAVVGWFAHRFAHREVIFEGCKCRIEDIFYCSFPSCYSLISNILTFCSTASYDLYVVQLTGLTAGRSSHSNGSQVQPAVMRADNSWI